MRILNLLLWSLLSVNAKSRIDHDINHRGNGNKRIVGGKPTTITKYPHHVALEREIVEQYDYKFTCGGSIISKQHILTAGHCVFDRMRVKVGINSILDPLARIIPVERAYVHPEYITQENVAYNDVAVLMLKWPIVFNDRMTKIALPTANWEPTDSIATVTGWGRISSFIPTPSHWLLKADVPIITNAECKHAWERIGRNSTVRDTNICTLDKNEPKIPCNGDSGGALVQDNKVVGIVSWGVRPCETIGAPSVYTRVSKFVDWINVQLTK